MEHNQCDKEDCCYAHHESELRKKLPAKYKTAICYNYQKGKCHNMYDCKHAHGESELRPISQIHQILTNQMDSLTTNSQQYYDHINIQYRPNDLLPHYNLYDSDQNSHNQTTNHYNSYNTMTNHHNSMTNNHNSMTNHHNNMTNNHNAYNSSLYHHNSLYQHNTQTINHNNLYSNHSHNSHSNHNSQNVKKTKKNRKKRKTTNPMSFDKGVNGLMSLVEETEKTTIDQDDIWNTDSYH